MPALWSKCKRCRRLYREPGKSRRCSFCPSGTKLHGIRRELTDPLEAAYLVGGMWAAQALVTGEREYDQLIDGEWHPGRNLPVGQSGNWPPREWLLFSYEHNRLHAHVNAAVAGIWAAAWLVMDWFPFAVPAVVFALVAVDHGLTARRARKRLTP